MRAVIDLDDLTPGNATVAGGAKIGRLVEMAAAGAEVPKGFVVGVDAYLRHCAESGLDVVVDGVLGELPPEPSGAEVDAASAEIRAAFAGAALPVDLAKAIADSYERLCVRCTDINLPVAVRSSATGEDGNHSSFAGIFDTYLGVAGPQAVLESVRDCWGSLFTARALAYRHSGGISHRDMPMAVGVLELIHARSSGVAFSVHPVSGKRDRIVVEGSWGWGEAIVQGLVTPDHAEIGKADLRVLRYDTARKDVVSAFDFQAGRVVEREMPPGLREARVLDDEELGAIAEAVRRIEEQYGHPVDVEWVVSKHRAPGGPVHIVQSRPVTVGAEDEQPQGWNPAAFAAKYAFQGNR
ncbi:PEP/pyruvate-binding domain-containing protein [Amycolatopsis alkalitolerans]|uniref:Phosphoenolpyruvate synthase n=1 Tax=Amycolatopsis alkalitolerans TaxID=2547244 RepID=A0A5C4M4R6_9PSEU|nr:PEP/pyruvate-binding domain-containing protein [Amycolatopsis alkalitolerans]TNC25172.1 pyruvate kinase [Amycolatopsis alkalitolerans]